MTHMKSLKDVIDEYKRQVDAFLEGYPSELLMFQELWAAADFRRAYALVQEVARQFELEKSPEMDRADEDFFWMYMH